MHERQYIHKPKKCGMSNAELAGEQFLNTCSHDPREVVIAGLRVRNAQREKTLRYGRNAAAYAHMAANPTRLS